MWTDNETDRDFLNFTGVARTVSEIIHGANKEPVSIGISGSWGVGKSSLIKLVKQEIESKATEGDKKYLFVEFNAWLYQGYDDARAALMEEIAREINNFAKSNEQAIDKAKDLLKKVDWLRTARVVGGATLPLMFGLPPIGLGAELKEFTEKYKSGDHSKDVTDKLNQIATKAGNYLGGFLKPEDGSTPPKEIRAIRGSFEKALEDLNITLVVLIDDLDRCLPHTAISTLEAIRLFLFLKNTAFVIAADNSMIKHAVRKHFEGVDDDLVTNYFDKLIQVPVRVPQLGTQEVRAYMMLLFIDHSTLDQSKKDTIREKVCSQLGNTWQGKRVDHQFIKSLEESLPSELTSQLDAAERLAGIMTMSEKIKGNPRLIKRFLNALSIRMSMAKSNGILVSEEVVAKMLLFERCGHIKAYDEILKQVMESVDGKSGLIKDYEERMISGNASEIEEPWSDSFTLQWLELKPQLGKEDLRGVLYLSREHIPIITPEDRLSPESSVLLQALLEFPQQARNVKDDLKKTPLSELNHIMGRVLDEAKREQEWGIPPILEVCLVISDINESEANRFSAFLSERPASQIKPSIVPKIKDKSWSGEVFRKWLKKSDISSTVKKAITETSNGDI